MAVKDVKVWTGSAFLNAEGKTITDTRIYVHMDDGREGCLYLTGNRYEKANTKTGDLTAEEWKEARALSIWDNKWHTVYAKGERVSSYTGQTRSDNYQRRCPDCGEIEGPRSGCGGGNCGANRPGRY